MSINLELQVTKIVVTSRGMECVVDIEKLSQSIMQSLFGYGVTQKIADAASQAAAAACEVHFGTGDYNKADAKAWMETDSGKAKVAETALGMMEKARQSLYDGTWSMRQGTGSVASQSPERKLAHDKAKAVLLATFKRAAEAKKVKGTIEHMRGLSPKIAAFFTDKNKWDETAVADYITRQASAEGGRDYMAEAIAELSAIAEATEGVDIGDMLEDL